MGSQLSMKLNQVIYGKMESDCSTPLDDKTTEVGLEDNKEIEKSPVTYRQKFLQTFWTFTTIFGLGAAVNVRGPALLDLQRSTGTSIDEITPAVFVTIALGWAVGSVVGGILYDRFEKQLVICVCVTVSGVFTGIVPWCTNVIVLSLVILISGASLAASYTGVATMTLVLWGSEAPPYMQMQDFSFSIGGVVGILILEAFTGSKSEASYKKSEKCERIAIPEVNNTEKTYHNGTVLGYSNYTNSVPREALSNTTSSVTLDSKSNFEYVYVILCIYMLISAIPFLIYYLRNIDLLKLLDVKEDQDMKTTSEKQKDSRLKYALLLCIFTLFFFFVGGNESFFGLMTTFAVNFLCWSRSQGNLIPSMTWAATATAQIFAIAFAKYFKPILIMVFSMTLGSLTLLVLILAIDQSNIVMWVCCAIYGIASAPIFPNGLSWMNTHISVSGKLMALVQIFGGLGAVAVPTLVGWLFDNVNGIWYLYVSFICALTCAIALYSGMVIGNKYGDRFSGSKENTETKNSEEPCQTELISFAGNSKESCVNKQV